MPRSWQWLVAACCGLALVTGCERRSTEDDQQLERVRKEPKEDIDQARREAAEKVEEGKIREPGDESDGRASADRAMYAAQVEQDIMQLDAEVDDLRAHSQRMSGEGKSGLEEALSRIDQNRKALDADLEKIETIGAADYPGLRNEIETTVRQLRKEVRSARDRWKPPGKT
jgi:hypothetical protein